MGFLKKIAAGLHLTNLEGEADVSAFSQEQIKKAAEGVADAGGIDLHLSGKGNGKVGLGATVYHVPSSPDQKG